MLNVKYGECTVFFGGKIGMLRDFFYFDVSVLVVSVYITLNCDGVYFKNKEKEGVQKTFV